MSYLTWENDPKTSLETPDNQTHRVQDILAPVAIPQSFDNTLGGRIHLQILENIENQGKHIHQVVKFTCKFWETLKPRPNINNSDNSSTLLF